MAKDEGREEIADAGEVPRDERYAAGVDGRQPRGVMTSIGRTNRCQAEQRLSLLTNRRADMRWGQVVQPRLHGNRAYYDIRNGIGIVKYRERLAQRRAVFDFGIGEHPGNVVESCGSRGTD